MSSLSGSNTGCVSAPSSPALAQNYDSSNEDSTDNGGSDKERYATDELENSNSPSTSPLSSPHKRRRYALYREDPSVPVPRETLRRWNLASGSQQNVTRNITTLCDDGSIVAASNSEEGTESIPILSQENESVDSTDSEAQSNESELNVEHYLTSESDSSSSSTDPITQEHQDDSASTCSETESIVSDDSDSNELLFSGCAKTTDEAVLDVCNLFLKHRWTKASLNDTLKFMAATLPRENNLPNSLHTLYNYVNFASAPCSDKSYFYCSSCLQPKIAQTDVCAHCNSTHSGVFYYFGIADQIKYMFGNDNLIAAIDDYRNVRSRRVDTQGGNISDILDGTEYQRVKNYANGTYDIILEWNSDGVSLSRSSEVKFYPLLSTVCEVPPKLRSYYLMVNAIWVDASAPIMSTFLKPFAEELTEIFEAGGVEWEHPEIGKVKSQVFAPLFVGDAPLRGDVLEVMRYNAIYGCEKCEQKAVLLPPKDGKGRSLRRLVFTETPSPERTTERMRLQGEHAKLKGKKHVKGVKGKSIVEDIPLLNRASCTLAEYMHCILLGVTAYFATMWFSKPGPWYIGNKKTAVDEFLSSAVKVLDFMRDARKISKIAYYKASEFRSWLLYFSLIVLRVVDFPDDFYQHWILLVKSVFILLQDEISQSDLESAEIMLRCFLRDISKLYSNYDYLYNVHQLSHLITYVRQWGPLSVNSAFLFESYNGVLSRMVHGTKHQAKELSENLKLARCIHVLDFKVKNSVNKSVSNSVASVHGKANKITLTNDDLELLRRNGIAEFETYRRASVRRVVYTSSDYDVNKKKCNSLIEFYEADKKCRGEIICFVKTTENVVCYVEKLKVRHSEIIFHRETMQKISHLIPMDKTNERVLVEFPFIACKVFRVGNYIATYPNKVETYL